MPNWVPIIEELGAAGRPALEEAAAAAAKLGREALSHIAEAGALTGSKASAANTAKTVVHGLGKDTAGELGVAKASANSHAPISGPISGPVNGPVSAPTDSFANIGRHQGGPVHFGSVQNGRGGPVEFRDRPSNPSEFTINKAMDARPAVVPKIPATEGLPKLTDKGFLPPGVYSTNVEDFTARFVTNEHRQAQWQRVEPMLRQLKAAGIDEVYAAGSFVSAKPKPGDIDLLVQTTSPLNSQASYTLDKLRGIEFGQSESFAKRTYGAHLMTEKASAGVNGENFKIFTLNRQDEPVGIVRLRLTGK